MRAEGFSVLQRSQEAPQIRKPLFVFKSPSQLFVSGFSWAKVLEVRFYMERKILK